MFINYLFNKTFKIISKLVYAYAVHVYCSQLYGDTVQYMQNTLSRQINSDRKNRFSRLVIYGLSARKTNLNRIVMNDHIPEKDWKLLRAMKDEKLALACEQILRRVEDIIQERKGKEHEAFLKVWRTLQKENAEIAWLFDDMRRSTAFIKLLAWRKKGLLNDEELRLFSAETRQSITGAGSFFRK